MRDARAKSATTYYAHFCRQLSHKLSNFQHIIQARCTLLDPCYIRSFSILLLSPPPPNPPLMRNQIIS